MNEGPDRAQPPVPGPDAPPPPPPPHAPPAQAASRPDAGQGSSAGRGGVWFGAVLVLVGVLLLVQIFIPTVRLLEFWPVIIIVAGVLMIIRSGSGGAR